MTKSPEKMLAQAERTLSAISEPNQSTVRRDAGLDALGLATRVDAALKTCPTCTEDIKAAALKCRYCGEVL